MLLRSVRHATKGLNLRHASTITRIGTDDPRMSRIVIHNGMVYLSGLTAADAGDNVTAQTAACLAKADALLSEAGTDKSRALSATIWLKDINSDFKGVRAALAMKNLASIRTWVCVDFTCDSSSTLVHLQP